MGKIAILGCTVPVDDPGDGLRHVDILVSDGSITAIADASTMQISADHARIDANGLVALPGLTNAHTHTPLVLMRGAAEDVSVDDWFNARVWPMEMNLTPERVLVGARLACAEMLLSGVTGFADHYFFSRQIAQAATELGIRANIAPTFFTRDADTGRERAFDDARWIAGLGSRTVSAAIGPHAPYTVSDADLVAAGETARELGVQVHIHAGENMQQTTSSLAQRGITPVGVLAETGILDAGALIAHGGGIIEKDADILRAHASRVSVACCPKVYFKHAIDPITPVRLLQGVGVNIAAGTDGAAGGNTLDVWEAMRWTALAQKRQEDDPLFLPVRQAFELATAGGARAAGNHGGGRIEVGAVADIVLVDLGGPHCQPLHDVFAALVYSVRASDVVTVLVDGEIVVRDRRLVRADLTEIVADAQRVAPELVRMTEGEAVQHYAP